MRRLVCLAFLLSVFTGSLQADILSISNSYIRIMLDDNNGGFMLETTGGDPSNPEDNDKALLYKKSPPTTTTTLNIDGENYIFGSDQGNFVRRGVVDNNKIISEWSVRGIVAIQELSFVKGPSTGREDTMSIVYRLKNDSGAVRKVGIRILLDTVLGTKEATSFGVPNIGNIDHETQLYRDQIPNYWYCFDNQDNPQIRTQGILSGSGTVKPDRIIFSTWDRLYNNPWDFSVDSTKDFRRVGTGQVDSAVALIYDELEMNNQENMYYSTFYGIYGANIFSSKDMKLAINVPASQKTGPVPFSAEMKNVGALTMDRVRFELLLPSGLTLPTGETNIIEFFKVNSGEVKKNLWNIQAPDKKSDYSVKLKLSGWVSQNGQTVDSEKSFQITGTTATVAAETNRAVEDLGKTAGITNTPDTNVVSLAVSNVTITITNTNVITLVAPVITNTRVTTSTRVITATEEQTKLLQQVSDIDTLIAQIDQRYQVLIGIFRNSAITNAQFITDLDFEIKLLENRLSNQEDILSNQLAAEQQ